jgi:ubiquinone/menaquinone biosynthesis C-methylase UbiE
MLSNLRSQPDRDAALARYRDLASEYDATCDRIIRIRQAAVDALQLCEGETVFDIGCGTGSTLPLLAERVGPQGRVLGIEQCPEMAALAQARVTDAKIAAWVSLVVAPIEEARLATAADAVLFCYTHDVLQSERALSHLMRHVKPHARVAVVGIRFLPWWWAAPINLYTALRIRRHITTYGGLRDPCHALRGYCSDLQLMRSFHAGTSYLASGAVDAAGSMPALT